MSESRNSGLTAAVLGVLGGSAAAAVIGYFSASTIEREKFDYALIQQALEADTPEEREQRLKFIIDMEFISNSEWVDNLSLKLKERPEEIPQLPKVSSSNQFLKQTEIKPFSKALISNFYSLDYGIRGKAYGEIISDHTNNPSVLIALLTSAPGYFDDGNAVVNTLTITKYFSDSAVLQAKLPLDIFLQQVTALVGNAPDQWPKTKKYASELRKRMEELEAK